MKILIVSDIKGESASIIPIGLNLARVLQSEAEIIHPIDSRINHGVPTPYADSHTVSPAEKLSFEEVIHKEKGEAQEKLEELLGREASRLNYPLKVNISIEETTIANKLLAPDIPSDSLLLVNREPDGQVFISTEEIVDTCKKFNGLCLLVSPGQELTEFKNILLPTDFTTKDKEVYEKISPFIKNFRPFINAVSIGNQTKTREWETLAAEIFPWSQMNCHALNGKDQNALIAYAEKIRPDLIVWPGQQESFLTNLFRKDAIGKLLKQTPSAVLFCCP